MPLFNGPKGGRVPPVSCRRHQKAGAVAQAADGYCGLLGLCSPLSWGTIPFPVRLCDTSGVNPASWTTTEPTF